MKTDNDIKMDNNELQSYLSFRRRGHKVESKKGKGSVYHRNKNKINFDEIKEDYEIIEDRLDKSYDSQFIVNEKYDADNYTTH